MGLRAGSIWEQREERRGRDHKEPAGLGCRVHASKVTIGSNRVSALDNKMADRVVLNGALHSKGPFGNGTSPRLLLQAGFFSLLFFFLLFFFFLFFFIFLPNRYPQKKNSRTRILQDPVETIFYLAQYSVVYFY